MFSSLTNPTPSAPIRSPGRTSARLGLRSYQIVHAGRMDRKGGRVFAEILQNSEISWRVGTRSALPARP